MSLLRTRWAAVGAAIAVVLGAGGIRLVSATNPVDATTFVAITPCRVVDTRPAPNSVGAKATPIGVAETLTVIAIGSSGNCTDVPAGARAVALNVTAVGATQRTFFTIWAAGENRPDASSLNPSPGAPPTPNAVVTELGTSGGFSVYNDAGTANVIVDINGYYVDHDHDDRYYTKPQTDQRIDAAIAAADPAQTSVRPHIATYLPQSDNWTFIGVWRFDGADDACLYAPFEVTEGTSIASIDVTYSANSPTSIAQVGVLGSKNTAGPTGLSGAEINFFDADVPLPASASGFSTTVSVLHDESEIPVAIPQTPTSGDGFFTILSVCGASGTAPFDVVSIEVELG